MNEIELKIPQKKEKYKILKMAILLAICCFLAYYFHTVLKIDIIFTHFFYFPIILACLWWRKKGIFVVIFLSALLIFSHIFFKLSITLLDDYFRVLMFMGIGITTVVLSERIVKANQKLQEYSKNLEKMVIERTKKLKDTQEELVRKEKLALLGQITASVSHELRNPLGVISNAIYYLKMILPGTNKEVKEYLEIISGEVKVSDKVISDLFAFSRTKVAEKEKVAISSLITDVLEKHPPSKKVKVTTNIPPSLPFIFVDSQQIKQVLINLITNSYQAMPEKGELRIKAKVNKGEVFIFITDTGSGISKENLKKLFEPLFTTKAKGVGLGLSIVRNLTEVNGGKIKAESKKGEGTTFTLVFPAGGEDGD